MTFPSVYSVSDINNQLRKQAIFIDQKYVGYFSNLNKKPNASNQYDWRLFLASGQQINDFFGLKKLFEQVTEYEVLNFIQSETFIKRMLEEVESHRPFQVEIGSDIETYFVYLCNISGEYKFTSDKNRVCKNVFPYYEALDIIELFHNNMIKGKFNFGFEELKYIRPIHIGQNMTTE